MTKPDKLQHRKRRLKRLERKLRRQQPTSNNAQETRYWIERTMREIRFLTPRNVVHGHIAQ